MRRNLPPNLGLKLAAVWLIVTGVIGLANLHFDGQGFIMSVLAVAAGVLMILER